VPRNKFLFNKTNRRTNFPNLFCQETLHVSGSSSAHHQELSTVPSALVYVMHFWWQLSSTTRMVVLESCHQNCMTYTSAEGTVENSWWWAEELPETCRVSWQNKFGKLARLLVLLKSTYKHKPIPIVLLFLIKDITTAYNIQLINQWLKHFKVLLCGVGVSRTHQFPQSP